MRTLVVAIAALTGLASVATSAAAQQFEQIEFQEFLVNEKKWNNQHIAMHAQFISDEAVFSDPTFDREYFKSNGVTDKKYFRFSLTWRAQTREWLYPVIPRKGGGETLWNMVKGLTKGDKLTLYGKVKRLGDTGAHGAPSDPTATSRASSYYSEVPSILILMRVKLGWVKTLPEYIADLGGDDELVADTIVMLKREGPGVLPILAKVAQSDEFSDVQRANACTAIGEFGQKSMARRLLTVVGNATAERIRTAAIVAAARLDAGDAIMALGRLLEGDEPDEWAPYGLAELVAAGLTDAPALAEAYGQAWDRRRAAVVDACLDIAETAQARKLFARAESFCTFAIALDAGCGAAFHLRGKARQAQLADKPSLAGLMADDYRKAVELGEEDADLFLFHAQALLKAGDKTKAARYAGYVLTLRPDDVEARKIQAAAEGKSVDMIDSRLARQYGATVRVPAKWEDRDTYVNLGNGEVLQLIGFPEGKENGKPQILLQGWAQDFPAGSTPATLDWVGSAKGLAERNGYTLVESGSTALEGDTRTLGWCVATRADGARTAKTLWALLPSNGRILTLLYSTDETTFDAHRVTLEESARTAAWEGKGK